MSYNFNPQPNFSRTSGGLSTASMHAVTPPTISSPFSIRGTYQLGAVNFSPDAQISGNSALGGQFTKGVISFWARYNPGAGTSGTNAIIAQTNGGSGARVPNNALTACSNNSPLSVGLLIQNIAVLLGPRTTNFYLADATSGQGLFTASVQSATPGGATSSLQWFDMGEFASLYHSPGSTFNGFSPFPATRSYIWVPSCANPPIGLQVYDNDTLNTGVGQPGPPPGAPPQPLVLGAIYLQGPGGVFHPANTFPGEVWLGKFEFSYQTGPTTGWHNYILSFDTSQLVVDAQGNQCIRVQLAIDRGGGPIIGGPLMDTMSQAVGPTSQPMDSWTGQGGITGTLAVAKDDTWQIGAPIDAPVDFAYCYMGIVPAGGDFFDLTVPRPDGSSRLNYFITEQLTPENLGFHGQNVPLLCNWMHTGATQAGAGGPYFASNAANEKVWNITGGAMTATDGPPIGA